MNVKTGVGVTAGVVGLNLALLPLAYSLSEPPLRLAPYPYFAGEPGWPEGESDMVSRVELDAQALPRGGSGGALRYRATSSNHLSFEAFGAWFREARPGKSVRWLGAGVRGEIARSDRGVLDWIMGGAGLGGGESGAGPRLGLGGALYPRRPLSLEGEATTTIIGGGPPVEELSAALGAVLDAVELRAGWRALVGPIRPISGPELSALYRY
ncbi:MAG: hypothetical protein KGM24_06760 [Elusimicrobia bacterium]|nr:hypothetical protein [Elusimicrobiota bacterium]